MELMGVDKDLEMCSYKWEADKWDSVAVEGNKRIRNQKNRICIDERTRGRQVNDTVRRKNREHGHQQVRMATM